MHEAATSPSSSIISIGMILDTVGTLFGIYAVIIVLTTLSKVGGQVGSAFALTLMGVILQTAAIFYDLLVEELRLLPDFSMGTPLGMLRSHNIHDGLMIIGIIFFVLAARQFAKLSQD